MFLTHLALTNFRNYAQLELDLESGVTVVQGGNACGKTSLLEAIFYLATSRSTHAGSDRELIRWGASDDPLPHARVQADIVKHGDTHTQLEILLMPAEEKQNGHNGRKTNGRVSKRIKVNGSPKRAIDLLGELTAVLFLPEDLNLVFGSPSDRRRYLDITLSQIDSRYGRALSRYNQVVDQRNFLLREFRERAYNHAELAVWDRQLVEHGTYLTARRAETIDRYNVIVSDIHARLTAQSESLQLIYQPSVEFNGSLQPSGVKEHRIAVISQRFGQQIAALRDRELAAATTLVGPHRDEIRFLITRNHDEMPIDATTYASRGQGRTVALSLKLAEVALMRGETGEDPVLLLDDVMSELDIDRRAALAQVVIESPQAIITTTDLDEFSSAFLDRSRVWSVCGGQIEKL
ncbi:MAG: DNA replication/repair protein RecF [Chloroflexi bacterium]|nr:DNA replication/repair protein RecF [Chloroflexota bacterium]